MSGMFRGCNSLLTLNGIEQWNTSSVKDKGYMFAGTPFASHPPI
jgi:surface protein